MNDDTRRGEGGDEESERSVEYVRIPGEQPQEVFYDFLETFSTSFEIPSSRSLEGVTPKRFLN